MAMVKVSLLKLTSAHLSPHFDSVSSATRPVSPAAKLVSPSPSCGKQQLRASASGPSHPRWTAARITSPRPSAIFSALGSMGRTGDRTQALSDQGSKSSGNSEDQLGGGNGDGGGGGEGGGHGDDDTSDENPKGDGPGSPFGWYLLLLNKHPVPTKAITSALLTLFGDLVCQLIFEKNERIDFTRLGIFTLLGLVLVGPTLHFWYLTLSKLVPGPGVIKAGSRLVLDQFLFSPIFIGVFISALMTLEGHSNDIVPKLRQDWLSVVVTNWKIWIPFQFLNFLVVPQQLQVLAANIIALAWNTYLSFAAHKTILPPAQKDSIRS